MEISQYNVTCLAVTAVLLVLLPLIPILRWRKRHGKAASWKYFAAGALGFLISARVLELGVHMVCIVLDNPVSRFINGHTWAYVLYGTAMAGIFEEVGRYVVLAYILKKNKTRENAVFYGIGHGSIEVWAVLLPTILQFLAVAVMVRGQGLEGTMAAMGVTAETQGAFLAAFSSLGSFGAGTAFANVFERAVCIALHTALTVIVFYAVKRGEKKYLLFAVLGHMLVDVMAALSQRGAAPLWAVEGWLLVWTAALAVWAGRLYRRMDGSSLTVSPGKSMLEGEKEMGLVKWKKVIAPVVITALVCLWFLFYIWAVFYIPEAPMAFRILGAAIPALLGGVAIYNLIERIKEIRSGEEDDLDNY